jgi:polysaccharide deacetylase 2 family uncharacterized protein YibQ
MCLLVKAADRGTCPHCGMALEPTGVIPHGSGANPELVAVLPEEGHEEEEVLRLAASLERGSEHPLAEAIVAGSAVSRLSKRKILRRPPARGGKGTVDGRAVALSNVKLFSDLGLKLADTTNARRDEGETVVFVIVMATGNNKRTARAVAAKLRIDEIRADVLPQDKAQLIKELQEQGGKVAMAGDAVNDAPALAQADVGIAMGTGVDVGIEGAGYTSIGGNLNGIARARRLSRATMRNIKQNLFFCTVLQQPWGASGGRNPVPVLRYSDFVDVRCRSHEFEFGLGDRQCAASKSDPAGSMKLDKYRLLAFLEFHGLRLIQALKPGSHSSRFFKLKWKRRLEALPIPGFNRLKAFFQEYGLPLGYALAGGTLGVFATIYLGAGDPPGDIKPISTESRFVSLPKAKPVVIDRRRQSRPNEPRRALAKVVPVIAVVETLPIETLRSPMPEPISQSGSTDPWRQFSVAYAAAKGRPRIVVVIDDMGMDKHRTARIIALPGPLTTSFLTYAPDLKAQTKAAQRAGHELMLHVPMEPMNHSVDAGRNVITTGLSREELSRRLDWALGRFDGFVGINNHMGSRFTANREGMNFVLSVLKQRGLLFLDSRTTSKSVGESVARKLNVPYVRRHVFLDHEPTPAGVARQMREAERIALRNGHVVVIGHPRDATIGGLRAWLSNLARRGFALVPISAVVDISHQQGRG